MRPVALQPTTDAARWDAACRASGQPVTPFHDLAFLRAAAGMLGTGLSALVVRDEGRDVGVAPWLTQRRGPVTVVNRTPFPYVGPLVPAELLPATLRALRGRARRERVVVEHQQFPPGTDVGAWPGGDAAAVEGYTADHHRTYVIDTTHTEPELFAAMSRSARKQVRKNGREGVVVDAAWPGAVEALGRVHRAINARKGLPEDYPYAFPPDPARLGGAAVRVRWTVARRHDRVLAALVTLLRDGRALTWVGGVLPEHRESGANVLLTWDAIAWAHAAGACSLDLVGLPEPGIEVFKRQFGGELTCYPVLARTAPGWRRAQQAGDRAVSLLRRGYSGPWS